VFATARGQGLLLYLFIFISPVADLSMIIVFCSFMWKYIELLLVKWHIRNKANNEKSKFFVLTQNMNFQR
jgi:hypothetical protein